MQGQSFIIVEWFWKLVLSVMQVKPVLTAEQISRAAAAAKSLQSCLTLCDPIDSRPPGSPIPGILQARTLEGAAIAFSTQWPQNYPNLFHHLHSFLFSVDADGNKLKKMEG